MRLVSCVLSMALLVGCSASDEQTAPPPPCAPDEDEPNDTVAEATSLGAIQDDGELQQPDAVPNKVFKGFSTHVAGDVDWYTIDVRDTGLAGNPEISVIVGKGHEATAFWSCTNGPVESVRCVPGTTVTDDPDLPSTRGCVTIAPSAEVPPQLSMQIECSGTSNDSGTLRIRVKRTAPTDTCERYTLAVLAE